MSNKLYEENSVQAIADAIRAVNGSTDTYKIGDMASAVAGISTGLNWSELNYDTSGPNKGTPQEVVDVFNYAKQIMNSYEVTSTYVSDKDLFFWPNIDLLSRYNCANMFDKSNLMYCPNLTLGSLESGAGNITTNYMFRQTWIEYVELSSVSNNTQTIYLNNTFYDCARLKRAKFNAPVSFGEGVFNGCTVLTDLTFASTPTCAQTRYIFRSCPALVTAPELDTSGAALFTEMFKGCTALENVPIYDFSAATNLQNVYQNCPALTDTSLDNILQSCISADVYTGTKSLLVLGIPNTYDARIAALPHYQDFIDAGWVIR
jgi:hypothetical protein